MAALESLKTQDRLLDRQAANSIRRQIVNGSLPPAHRLLESALARDLEVSRGTIRSALMQLTAEGLVSQVAFTKWEVAPASVHEAWELYTLRSALEGLAARLVAQSITPEQRDALEDAFRSLEVAVNKGDAEAIVDADFNMHSTLVGLAGHKRLTKEHEKLIQQVRFQMTHIGLTGRDYSNLLVDHGALKDAVISGDAETAERLAANHNSAEVERLLAAAASEKSADTSRASPG